MPTNTQVKANFNSNPDQQMPMPFAAADLYAQQVMDWGHQAPDAGMRVLKGIAYGADRLHCYDVYAPQDALNAPVLVFWHGGGWTNGYRNYVRFMAEHVTALGCVLVAPSYRLVPQVHLHQVFEDCLTALAHVVQHSASYGGASDRFYLSGHSAGGHLAALVALRTARCLHAGIPGGKVRGCLAISGIMDLHHPCPATGSLEERVYSMVLAAPEHDALLSPICWATGNQICWATGNQIAFDLTIGQHDSERVRRSNARLYALLKEQKSSVALADMAGQSHFETHTTLREGEASWYARLARMVATPCE